mmetsp:Transcript_6293/g.19203  ORF Transcript_6293/g.19203 Transcript_6293/m.19203 type:complete len:81 (-) Transcript_6293:315-557(-)|eukprot:scaffold18271_cov29-Tisochrysis_lutea.AAC.2
MFDQPIDPINHEYAYVSRLTSERTARRYIIMADTQDWSKIVHSLQPAHSFRELRRCGSAAQLAALLSNNANGQLAPIRVG